MSRSTVQPAKPRRSVPNRAQTPENAAKAARGRWSFPARCAESIRILVEAAPDLTDEQLEQLQPVFARLASQGGA